MKLSLDRVVLLLISLIAINFYGQEIQIPFELSKDKKAIFLTLPLENKKDSLVYFFDTGAGIAMLDSQVAHKNGFKVNKTIDVSGAGGKKSYDLLTNQKLFLTNKHSIDSTSVVLDDLSRLSELFEKKFDGIIGATILKNYLTKVDLDTKMISLYEPSDYVDYTGYEKISFEFNSGIPKIPISFELTNSDKLQGEVLFDSGAGLTLLVSTPYKEQNNLSDKMDEKIVYSSSNLSNKTYYERGLIRSLSIGSFKLEKQDISISLSSDKEGVSASESLLGILGSEIIHRFNFILDYKNQLIYLKPNTLYESAFEPLISPITLKYNEERSMILISNVLEHTDASRKGLKEGYRIISIDNITSNELYEYEQLLKQDNKKVVIKYIDNQRKERSVTIKLKKLLQKK